MKNKVIALVLLLVSLVAIAHVMVSSTFVTSGKTLAELERDITALSEENEELQEHIASASALRTIEDKAHSLGFEKTASVFIPSKLPVAFGTSQ